MGLDTTASHIVWAIATTAMVVAAAGSFFDTAETLDEARAARESMMADRLAVRVAEATWCHMPSLQELRVATTNAGKSTSTEGLAFLLDGVAVSSYSVDVSGAGDTTVWGAGEPATFTLSGVAAAPSDVALVTASGTLVPATLLPCPVLTTIVVTPSDVVLDPGATQTFSAQGYDQYGAPLDASPFSWTSDAGSIVALNGTSARLTAGTAHGTGFFVEASSGDVSGLANVTIRQNVHVDDITTYESGSPTTSFKKKETVETRVTIRDHTGALVQDASVNLVILDPNTATQYSGAATTTAQGIAYFNYTLPPNPVKGTWTVRVTDITGDNMRYDQAADIETEVTFTV